MSARGSEEGAGPEGREQGGEHACLGVPYPSRAGLRGVLSGSSSKGQGASGRMTCHPQGQFQGPSSSLQSFLRGRSGVALERHVTFCPPEVFLRSERSVVAPCRVRETRECSNSFNSCSSSPASHLHCCHRPRERLGGTRTDYGHRGTDREDVGRTVLQAE